MQKTKQGLIAELTKHGVNASFTSSKKDLEEMLHHIELNAVGQPVKDDIFVAKNGMRFSEETARLAGMVQDNK